MRAINGSRESTEAKLDNVLAAQRAQASNIADLAGRTERLESVIESVRDTSTALEQRVANLEARSSTAGFSGPASSASHSSSRRRDPYYADPALLRITAAAPVSRDAVTAVVKAVADAAHIPDDAYQITGPSVAKWFHMRLCPTHALPVEDAARAILAERRDERGAWKDLAIRALEGADVRIYMDNDRCLADRRINWHITAASRSSERGIRRQTWPPHERRGPSPASGRTSWPSHTSRSRTMSSPSGMTKRSSSWAWMPTPSAPTTEEASRRRRQG